MAAMLMPKPLAAAPSKSAPEALGEDEEVVPLVAEPVLLEDAEEAEPVEPAATAEAVELAEAGASVEWQMPEARVSGGML